MKYISSVLFVAVFTPGFAQVPDGIYLVISTDQDSIHQSWYDGPVSTIKYDYRMVDSVNQVVREITIANKVHVPLDLAGPPDREQQQDLRYHVFLTLDRTASERLREMTTQYTGRRVAVVIGGSAVTMHKVREPIIGSRLQISRCTDHACEFLYGELRDNVKH